MTHQQEACKKCKVSFAPEESGDPYLCAGCRAAQEEHDVEKILRYLEGHPHDTLIDIVCGTGVTMNRVRKLLDGGRLDRRKKPRI